LSLVRPPTSLAIGLQLELGMYAQQCTVFRKKRAQSVAYGLLHIASAYHVTPCLASSLSLADLHRWLFLQQSRDIVLDYSKLHRCFQTGWRHSWANLLVCYQQFQCKGILFQFCLDHPDGADAKTSCQATQMLCRTLSNRITRKNGRKC